MNHVWQGEHFGDNDVFFILFFFFHCFHPFVLVRNFVKILTIFCKYHQLQQWYMCHFVSYPGLQPLAVECTSSADYIDPRLKILFLQNYFVYYTNLKETLKIYANSWQSEMMFRNILEPDKMSSSPYLLDTMEVK